MSGLESCVAIRDAGFAMRRRRAFAMTKIWLPASTEWLGAGIWISFAPNNAVLYCVAIRLSFRQVMGAAETWTHAQPDTLYTSFYIITLCNLSPYLFLFSWFWASKR